MMKTQKTDNKHKKSDVLPAEKTLPVPFSLQWLFFFILAVFYILSLRTFFEASFATNDNIAILDNIKNGFLAPFVHVLWSYLLSALFVIIPHIPWYGLALYFLQAISISIVLFVFYREISRRFLFILFCIVYLFFQADMIIRLDYSGTSIIFGSSLFLLFFHLHRQTAKTPLYISLLIGTGLSITAMPRTLGLFFVFAVALPFIFFQMHSLYQSTPKNQKPTRRIVLLSVFLFFPSFFFWGTDRICRDYFVSEDERAYSVFNELRGKFHGFPVEKLNINNQAALDAAGWTQSDYIRLVQFMFFDETIYNTSAFERFYAHADMGIASRITILQAASALITVIKNYLAFLLLIAAILLITIFDMNDHRRLILYFLCAVSILCLCLLLELFFRFPNRIGDPMLHSAILYLIFFSTFIEPGDRTFLKKRGGGAIIILSCLIIFYSMWLVSVRSAEQSAMVKSIRQLGETVVKGLNEKFEGGGIILQGNFVFTQAFDPLRPPKIDFTIIIAGWNTFSPLFYKQIRNLGIDRGAQLIEALIDRNDYMILSKPEWRGLIEDYAVQKKLKPFQFKMNVNREDFQIYRLKS